MKTSLQATPIFSSFLGVGQLEVDHEKVMNWVNEQEIDAHNRIKLNFGEEALSELYDEMLALFNDIHSGLGLKSIYEQVFERGWVNTGDNQRFNLPHKHPRATFVSVYYPYVEGDVGELEMINPNPMTEYVLRSESDNRYTDQMNIYNSNLWRVKPQTGLVAFFPSWIQHYALPTTNGKRVSIAIDTVIKHKNQRRPL